MERRILFETNLSLEYLIKYWEKSLKEYKNSEYCSIMLKIIDKIKNIKELNGVIEDVSYLEKYKEEMEFLLSFIVPYGNMEKSYIAVVKPFSYEYVFKTAGFDDYGFYHKKEMIEEELKMKNMFAYINILKYIYNVDLNIGNDLVFKYLDKKTGMNKFAKFEMNVDYCEIITHGEKPELSESNIIDIKSNIDNIEYLKKILPPEKFEYRGIIVINGVDITEQKIVSDIKQVLLEKESLISKDKLEQLEIYLKNYLKRSDLHIGVSAIKNERVMFLNIGHIKGGNCIFKNSTHYKISDFYGTAFYDVYKTKKPQIICDINKKLNESAFYQDLRANGKICIAVIPIIDNDKVIGILSIAAGEAGSLNILTIKTLEELMPIFAIAIQRGLDEFENNIQLMIQQKFTSIHPSVEWRFKRAAINHIEKNITGKEEEIEDIIFENVYPLYSISDIRGSTNKRNASIQKDLIEHLLYARKIMEKTGQTHDFLL